MLRIEENYAAGVPQTSVPGFAPHGLVWHWTAGSPGRAGALGTIQHFINTRYTVNASYHILFWVEHAASHGPQCTTYAMWIVPGSRAAHSLAPGQAFVAKYGDAEEAARFAEVRRILARDWDPNADVWAVSYCGMPAGFAADAKCPEFMADLRRLAAQLIAHPTFIVDRPHFGHGWIQPTTRYEMDNAPNGADMLIAPLYSAPEPTTEVDEMPHIEYLPELWTAGADGCPVREQLGGPEVGRVPAGAAIFTHGTPSATKGGPWRLGVVSGEPRRTLFFDRAGMFPRVTGSANELDAGINTVIDSLVTGQPFPGGYTQAQLDLAVAAATKPLNDRITAIKGKTQAFATDIADD